MSTKVAELLSKHYPGWRLHCDVTASGLKSYQIVVSLIDRHGNTIETVTHYGSKDINTLKEEAINSLMALVVQPLSE
jgi:hypothetical protein